MLGSLCCLTAPAVMWLVCANSFRMMVLMDPPIHVWIYHHHITLETVPELTDALIHVREELLQENICHLISGTTRYSGIAYRHVPIIHIQPCCSYSHHWKHSLQDLKLSFNWHKDFIFRTLFHVQKKASLQQTLMSC